MFIVSGLLLAVGVLFWLPIVSDVTSLIKASVRRPEAPEPDRRSVRPLLFVVPAHDEEDLIVECVRSLRELDYPEGLFRILVVADNCSDRTAALAREAGASCLERNDPSNPGKPFAVAWAVSRLDLDRFDALVIVDADSTVDIAFAREIAGVPNLTSVAVQAFDGVSNPQESNMTRMAAVLAAAHHRFAYPLKQRAGLNVPLTGTGMCVGTGVLRQHGWNALSLAEDVEFYVLLTLAGVRTFCRPEARVLSAEAPTRGTALTQRHRWSRGRLDVAREQLRAIVGNRRIGAHQKLDLLGELLTPGPATHPAVAALAVTAAWAFELPAREWIVALAVGSLVRPATYASLGLSSVPDRLVTAAAFLTFPAYAAWRLGVQVLSLLHRPTWTRGRR